MLIDRTNPIVDSEVAPSRIFFLECVMTASPTLSELESSRFRLSVEGQPLLTVLQDFGEVADIVRMAAQQSSRMS